MNNDSSKKQVVFMIGAGGSGKSYSLSKSEYHHLPVVNSDTFIEASPDWVGNGGNKEAFELHEWASDLMEADWNTRLGGDESFILDGTGKTRRNVEARMEAARAAGFSVTIFWVYAPLETCLARNAKRERVVPEEVIRDAWVKVKANFPAYRKAADHVKVTVNYELIDKSKEGALPLLFFVCKLTFRPFNTIFEKGHKPRVSLEETMSSYEIKTTEGSITIDSPTEFPWSALTGVKVTLSFEDGTSIVADARDIVGISQEGGF